MMLIKLDHEFYIDPQYIQSIHADHFQGNYKIQITFSNRKKTIYVSYEYLTDLEEALDEYFEFKK